MAVTSNASTGLRAYLYVFPVPEGPLNPDKVLELASFLAFFNFFAAFFAAIGFLHAVACVAAASPFRRAPLPSLLLLPLAVPLPLLVPLPFLSLRPLRLCGESFFCFCFFSLSNLKS
jgi:hypothetical protein